MREYIIYILWIIIFSVVLHFYDEPIMEYWRGLSVWTICLIFFVHNLLIFLLSCIFFTIYDNSNSQNKIQFDVNSYEYTTKQRNEIIFWSTITGLFGRPTNLIPIYYVTSDIYTDLDSSGIVFFKMAITYIGYEIWFYYLHRLLHNDRLYGYLHRVHHITKSPNVWTTYCTHIVELWIINMYFIVAQYFLQVHPIHMLAYTVIPIFNEINSHSGYRRTYFPPPNFHDMHHEKVRCNYGLSDYLDKFHGTYCRPQ